LLKIGGKANVERLLFIIELKVNNCHENQPTINNIIKDQIQQQVKKEKRLGTNLWRELMHYLGRQKS
jgi:hypothetical protein